jgi:hypothetical protein
MSSPGTRPLRHVLYTIARGEGRQQGYRAIFDYFNGEVEEKKEVVEWLNRLEVSVEEGYGWAARGFVVGGARHATLAVLNPYFGLDDLGSTAALYHALLVPVPDNQPSGHFYLSLYEAAIRFMSDPSPQVQSLQNYLKGCQIIKDLTVPELDPAGLVNMSSDFLRALLITAAHPQTDAPVLEVSLPARTDEELPGMLAMAGGVIPPSLRLAFRWATGVKPASGLLVARRRSAGEGPSGAQGNLGEVYFEWLKERLDQHQFDAIREIAEDPSIISWERLRERIAALPMANVEPTRRVLNASEILEQEQAKRRSDRASDPIPQKEKTPMKRGQRSKAADSSSPGNLADVRELIQNEFKNMWESVREYLDDRLSQMGGPTMPPPESRDRTIRRLQAFRPEIYFFVVLLLLGGLYWRVLHGSPPKGANQPASVTQTGASGSASTQVPSDTPAEPDTSDTSQEETSGGEQEDKYVVQWRGYLKAHPDEIAKQLEKMVGPKRRVPMSDKVKNKAKNWIVDLRGGKSLNDQDVTDLTTALFEYAHGDWAVQKNEKHLEKNLVSLNTDEVIPEHLKAILQDLRLSDLGPNPDRDNKNVQAAVVLKWPGFEWKDRR